MDHIVKRSSETDHLVSIPEVLNFKSEDVENIPAFGTRLDTDYILDIDPVLNARKRETMDKAACPQ